MVLSSKETSFIRGLRSQMPFPGNRIFPEKILEISRPELWEQPFPGPHSVYVSCLLTTLHFVSKADQSQRFFKSVFCYKDLFLLMFVVDVEFHPKLHFLTHQSNEPSGNNAYNANPLCDQLSIPLCVEVRSSQLQEHLRKVLLLGIFSSWCFNRTLSIFVTGFPYEIYVTSFSNISYCINRE